MLGCFSLRLEKTLARDSRAWARLYRDTAGGHTQVEGDAMPPTC